MHFVSLYLKTDSDVFLRSFFLTKSIIFTGKKKKEPTFLDTWWDLKGCVLNVREYCTAAI